MDTKLAEAKYNVGQVIHHRLFDYRGVIVDVDPNFQNTEEWYALMAKSKPARNQPWYHVLVDNTDYTTYVAEQNLESDSNIGPVQHPELEKYFNQPTDGVYTLKQPKN